MTIQDLRLNPTEQQQTKPLTRIQKNAHGNWEARTMIDLPEAGKDRIVVLLTCKRSNGRLATTATAATRSATGYTYAVYKDWHQVMLVNDARCTAKNVEAQHDRALYLMDVTKPFIVEFYNDAVAKAA
jgi:hypothetical protein